MRTSSQSAIALETYFRPILLTIFLCGVGMYAIFQARYLIHGPQIMLYEPTALVHDERVILVRGEVRHITSISLNGREIYTDEEGRFSEPLVLENGYTIMTLRAKNRYGRTITMMRPFIYEEETTIN